MVVIWKKFIGEFSGVEYDELVRTRKDFSSLVTTCNKITSSVAQYITYASGGLEAMIDSAYGAANPNLIAKLYGNSKEKGENLPQWTSQLGQDSLAACLLDMKTGGYFIEIGCGNGTIISNSYSLETFLNWKGLLIEPNPIYCQDMRRTRTSTVVERAISARKYQEDITLVSATVYGSCVDGEREGPHAEFINACEILNLKQKVKGIEVSTLCKDYEVPSCFEYLSLDIEGGELDIIRAWPFTQHRPLLLSVEHNYGPDRWTIRAHLASLGYTVFGLDFDDFFISNELLELSSSNANQHHKNKMDSESNPETLSTSCYRSRLLVTNWAMRDQFRLEIQRLKDESTQVLKQATERIAELECASEKMIQSANQRIADLEDSKTIDKLNPYKIAKNAAKAGLLANFVINKTRALINKNKA